MDDLEALLADLQSAAPSKPDDSLLKADKSSLTAQEWPAPPPPVDTADTDLPQTADVTDAPKEEENLPQTNSRNEEKGGSPNSEDEKPPPIPPLPKEFQQGPTMKPPTSTSANLAELDNLLEALNTTPYTTKIDAAALSLSSNRVPESQQPTTTVMSPSHANVKALLSELDDVIESDNKAASNNNEDVKSMSEIRASTTTATKELDALMASLSDFKVSAGKKGAISTTAVKETPQTATTDGSDAGESTTAPYAIPKKLAKSSSKQEIDSMLGTLQSDVTAHGVDTASKGICPACKKAIVGQVVTALGATWHPEHFTCVSCNMQLSHQTFFERDGRPYCEKDYHDLFSPRCAYCSGPVLDSCITAMGKTWHPDHFFCSHCGRPFGTETFHEKDSKAYCEKDYFELFAPRCGACNKPIMEGFVSAINQQWHTACFVCWACKKAFAGGNFFEHENKPFCEFHYHERRGSLCYGCHKPILGRCITAMSKKFHPEHFVCAFCLKQLNKGTFKESHEKPYCHPCFIKLFG